MGFLGRMSLGAQIREGEYAFQRSKVGMSVNGYGISVLAPPTVRYCGSYGEAGIWLCDGASVCQFVSVRKGVRR